MTTSTSETRARPAAAWNPQPRSTPRQSAPAVTLKKTDLALDRKRQVELEKRTAPPRVTEPVDRKAVKKRAKKKRSTVAKGKTGVKVAMRLPWVKHVMRMAKRFSERLGNQFAAAITYFSVLALIPLLMVAFSIVGFVLSSRPDLLTDLKDKLANQLSGGSSGGGLGKTISDLLNHAVDSRYGILSIGLVLALYSGLSWMGNIRQAVQAQWRPDFDDDQETRTDSFIVNLWKNFYLLVLLGLALVVSFAVSTAGNALTSEFLKLLGLSDITWLKPVFIVVGTLIAVVADVLLFMAFYTLLPQKGMKAPRNPLIIGSLIAAVGFEILKFALTFILPTITKGPAFSIFGPIIGLMFFFNLVATLVLYVAAWIATSEGAPSNAEPDKDDEQNEVLEPAVVVNDAVSRPKAAGLIGVGALIGAGAALRSRRH